jgi:putative ABC transport system permease protein
MRREELDDGIGHAVREGALAALAAIRANALRSALTTLGIVIGVAAVIAVVAIMQGLSRNIVAQLDDLGSDMVTLRAYTTADQQLLGSQNRIDYDDFLALKARALGAADMTAQMRAYSYGASVSFGRRSEQTQLIGTDSSYQNVVRVYPQKGRFLAPADDARRRRVAVLGPSLVHKLQIAGDPVGQFVQIGGEWFRVVGVAEARGSLFGLDQDNYLIAPFSTLRSLYGEKVERDIDILFRPDGNVSLQEVQAGMIRVLRQRHRIAAGAPDPFEFVTAERMREQFGAIVRAVTLVGAGVVGISLLVGGIGVMNIMLVSVTERTREIGIVKALGATPRFILVQFLIEALGLSLFGGLVGLGCGWGLAALMAMTLPGMEGALVPWWAVALALGFTTAIGVLFGLAPAIKAARLPPIEALRYE